MSYDYRVFISYSREDRAIAVRVVELLRGLNMLPMWDEDLPPGPRFTEEIKAGIAFSHVFVPIITAAANSRPWVHQEIGYATALNVPVLPLAIGELPEGLIGDLHGKRLGPDLADLPHVLTRRAIDTLVSRAEPSSRTPAECALTPHERTQRIVQLAERVRDFGSLAHVRQRGGLGTFSLPRKTVAHPIWRQRDGETERTHEYRDLQRQERLILEQHAQAAGCDLVLDPTGLLNTHGPQARAARQAREALAPARVVVRFIGATPGSAAGRALLDSLCHLLSGRAPRARRSENAVYVA